MPRLGPRPKRPKLMMTRTQAESFTPVELEIMTRLKEHESPERIQAHLGLTQEEYVALTQNPRWESEYEFQLRDQDRKIRPRLDRLAAEALDVIVDVMRTATSPAYQLRAALEILDRAGHVKVEKSIHMHANAEAIIRHLNQLGTEPAQIEASLTDAEIIVDEDEHLDATQSIEAAAAEVRRLTREKNQAED